MNILYAFFSPCWCYMPCSSHSPWRLSTTRESTSCEATW
jgi:hypothetical protein